MATTPFSTLRRLARPRATPQASPEHCGLCSAVLAPVHRHLLEVANRQIVCACDPCALRFHGVLGGRFALVPRDARALPAFRLSDAQWESLALPIGLAFFFYSTPHAKVTALYPSPAGATESLLPLSSWEVLVSENPPLAQLQPDVEALLVNRVGTARQYYVAPIDACYELVGLIRVHWRGLSGGEVVWGEIEQFFSRLQTQTGPVENGYA
jgi:hypothetical protein